VHDQNLFNIVEEDEYIIARADKELVSCWRWYLVNCSEQPL